MGEYRVLYTRVKGGGWSASVRGLAGRRGRTLREARARLREALATRADARPLDLVEDDSKAKP